MFGVMVVMVIYDLVSGFKFQADMLKKPAVCTIDE